MSSHIRFNESDAEEYQPSDSEDDLDERDKNLLKKARNKGRKYSDSEEEVLDVNGASSESDIALSDVEGQGDEDDGIPDVKAWGKNKRSYYSTDYVDGDYGGFQGKDGAMAELEEEEAKKLQTELAKTMDDDDFVLDFQSKDVERIEKGETQVIKTDVSKLSKRQRLQLLKKESPEFFGLVEDYEAKMLLVQDTIRPIIRLHKEGKVAESKAVEFVAHYYELILNYTTNIVMYLLLKSKGVNVQKHPVIKRLFQYRQLISQMDPVFEEVIKAQIEIVIDEATQKEKHEEIAKSKKKTLKLLSKLSKKQEVSLPEKAQLKRKREDSINKSEQNGKVKLAPANESSDDESGDEIEEEITGNNEEEPEAILNGEEVAKRGITYQIAKNKGLTPYRKKELRNPRVKHRNKFRKAKIRRKGAVREVRTELSRYGGEISGIKTSVTKSIKIKT